MSGGGFFLLGLERHGDRLRAEVEIAIDGPWFAGHFPGEPILPAIAHFDLLCRVHRAAGGAGRVVALDRVRLARPVRPGERLALTLETTAVDAAKFVLRRADGATVSDGTVKWAVPEGASG